MRLPLFATLYARVAAVLFLGSALYLLWLLWPRR
jgi:hypothetical protein